MTQRVTTWDPKLRMYRVEGGHRPRRYVFEDGTAFVKAYDRDIEASDVWGVVHVAKKDRGDCYICRDVVKTTDKYIQVNVPFYEDPVHLSCWLDDHSNSPGYPLLLGIKVKSRLVQRHGIVVRETTVICKEFKA